MDDIQYIPIYHSFEASKADPDGPPLHKAKTAKVDKFKKIIHIPECKMTLHEFFNFVNKVKGAVGPPKMTYGFYDGPSDFHVGSGFEKLSDEQMQKVWKKMGYPGPKKKKPCILHKKGNKK